MLKEELTVDVTYGRQKHLMIINFIGLDSGTNNPRFYIPPNSISGWLNVIHV